MAWVWEHVNLNLRSAWDGLRLLSGHRTAATFVNGEWMLLEKTVNGRFTLL
jgi:hypothetical protein